MTLFDVLTKREADDTGLPKQATDAELLAWSETIRAMPQPRRRLVAAPEPARRVLRARPLVAAPCEELDYAR